MALKFDTGTPLIIMVERNEDGEWEIRPSRTEPADPTNPTGPKQHQEMQKRAFDRDSAIMGAWSTRRSAGAPNKPHYKTEPDHQPVAVFAGEKVRFRSDPSLRFTIWVERDPNLSIVTGSPQNPFGFTLPETFNGNSGAITVVSGIVAQRFYKMTAWIETPEGTIVVDPDVLGID